MAETALRASPNQLRMDMMRGPRIAALVLLATLLLMLAGGVLWAQQAELDEVTAGVGQVIPSSEVQVVQNLIRIYKALGGGWAPEDAAPAADQMAATPVGQRDP